MVSQVQLDFVGIEIWLPIVVAIVSVILAGLCVRLLNSNEDLNDGISDQEELEDEKLNQTIKATLNPDRIHIQENTIVEEDTDKEEDSDNIQDSDDDEDDSDNEDLNVQKQMSRSERENERRIEQEQLQIIFKLMEENKEKFGVKSIGDVKEQLKRYKAD